MNDVKLLGKPPQLSIKSKKEMIKNLQDFARKVRTLDVKDKDDSLYEKASAV